MNAYQQGIREGMDAIIARQKEQVSSGAAAAEGAISLESENEDLRRRLDEERLNVSELLYALGRRLSEVQTKRVRESSGLSIALLDFMRLTGVSVWAGPFKDSTSIQSALARYNRVRGTSLKLTQEEFDIVTKDRTELCKIWRVSVVNHQGERRREL